MQEDRQEKSPIKQKILLYLEKKGITQYEFYKNTGVTRGVLGQNNGISEENLSRFLAYYKDINLEWLFTGSGTMIKGEDLPNHNITDVAPCNIELANIGKPIPLVTQSAVAGFGNSDFAINNEDIKELYVIPKFKHRNVDFMIEVSGASMYPRYTSGDIVACSILRESRFIQWNNCHVIATIEQGILLKRLLPGDDGEHLKAVSDNRDFPPFDIPVNEIKGIALVVGMVRLD